MIRASRELRTIWLMGVKTRIIPEFIDAAVDDLLPSGGTLLDLCSGTGVVGRALAGRYRILANDVSCFALTLAGAYLVGPDGWSDKLEFLVPDEDLQRGYEANFEGVRGLEAEALHQEDLLLPRVIDELTRSDPGPAVEAYREFLASTPVPDIDPDSQEQGAESRFFRPLSQQVATLLGARRRDPRVSPNILMTLFYQNVYFGVRQAMVIDSLRAAIERIRTDDPFHAEKQRLYLAALVSAASVSTSGTSHFAQPRSVRKDSELLAVARRRSIDIRQQFDDALDSIRREWGKHRRHPNNQVFNEDVFDLLTTSDHLSDDEVDLVYFDPPYTADNYSRFYHVLEVLVKNDYPELEKRGSRLTQGRYPLSSLRHMSLFCKQTQVEDAFKAVVAASRKRGANLIVSYSADSGLLLKTWRNSGESDPVCRFRDLFRQYYGRVEIREKSLMHSGQGDSNKRVRELLVLCEQ